MKEWKNNLNSFNSLKGLLYIPWYVSIKDWMDGNRKAPLPPIEASLDPIHYCNLKCEHCNANRYLEGDKEIYKIPEEHLFNIIDFLSDWGVLGVCYGGGGEPTLHNSLTEALYRSTRKGLESSIATNGTAFTPELITSMARNCRWVGISVDSATSETYGIGRRVNLFDKTISNMSLLVEKCKELKSNCDVSYKFLIFDYNQHEIFEACKLAKKIGVKDFHVRPADWSHQGMGEKKKATYDIKLIEEQFTKCHEIEDENFRVFTVVHKFTDTYMPRKDFSQCYASPCCIQICADGNVYLCPDTRFNEFYKLGSHYPDVNNIKKFWGNENHKKLVFETGKSNCTSRCTFNPYCKQCEELIINNGDPFCWKFI